MELHHQGTALGTIKLHRSVLSAFHAKVDGFPVGRCEETSLLMKGISNSKPIVHKKLPVWDVSVVLEFMSSKENESSFKFQSQKLVTLLAITSLHRGMELHALSLDLMSVFHDRVEFLFAVPLKHSKEGKKDPPSIFHEFAPNKLLCPKECIIAYLEVTNKWRRVQGSGPFFLSLNAPHSPVTKQTLCRWVKDFLTDAGIKGFKTHSTRGASARKALVKGVNVTDILSKGNWSRRSTFERFYNRPITTPATRVQSAILSQL